MIKLVKICGGDDFVAETIDQGDGTWLMENAMQVIPVAPGELKTIPFPLLSSEHTFVLREIDILFMVDPLPSIVNAHKEKFGGIITPQDQGLIL